MPCPCSRRDCPCVAFLQRLRAALDEYKGATHLLELVRQETRSEEEQLAFGFLCVAVAHVIGVEVPTHLEEILAD